MSKKDGVGDCHQLPFNVLGGFHGEESPAQLAIIWPGKAVQREASAFNELSGEVWGPDWGLSGGR